MACKNDPPPTGRQLINKSTYDKLPPKLKYLATLANYDSVSIYQKNFNDYYQGFLQKKRIDSAGACLIQYGFCVCTLGIVDTHFIQTAHTYVAQFENHKDSLVGRTAAAVAGYIGRQYSYKGDLEKGNFWLKKCIQNPRAAENKIAENQLTLSTNYRVLHEMDSALPPLLAYTAYTEKVKDTINMSVAYYNLSEFYLELKAYSEFENYNTKAYRYAALKKDSILMSVCVCIKLQVGLSQKFDTLSMIQRIDDYEKQFFNSVQNNPYLLFKYYTTIYEKYRLKQNVDSCAWIIQQMYKPKDLLQSISVDDELKSLELNLMMLQHRSDIDFVDMEKRAQRIEESKNIRDAAAMYTGLYQIAQKTKYPKASYYLEQKHRLENLHISELQKGKLYELEKKFQTQQKEKKIVEQKIQLEKSKFKITILLFSLLGLLLATLAFLGIRKRKEAQAETIRQQKFTDELMQNTEDERKRIASDLHDGVNHELLTLKNKTLLGQHVASEDLDKVINEVRQVSRDLFPAMFDNIGLQASIETLCERMTEAGLFTTCDINYTMKLSKRNELQLYRIIQEALNNTLKHAKADAAKVTIDAIGNELLVEIKDNGIGFDIEDKINHSSSFGLQSLMQRARAIGGKAVVESNEKGTKLLIKISI